ncbi:MerR family transcriptional regulator [Streptomyces sp. NBC_00820]|nr:MerR family transcriptional regulator [Streptomyces sp. NBC_00820]
MQVGQVQAPQPRHQYAVEDVGVVLQDAVDRAPGRDPQPHPVGADRVGHRVIRIQELYAAGLHSERIRRLLPCMRDQDGGPSAIATPRLVADLAAERDRIDRMIADLARSRDTLDEVIKAAGQP